MPFVSSKSYAQYAGVGSGLLVPSIKTLLGDASDLQKQTLFSQSMPQYLELKRGQEASKLVYLPRFGYDKMIIGRVLFISDIGDKQSVRIHLAFLMSPDEAKPK